jgi:hypothetical protein
MQNNQRAKQGKGKKPIESNKRVTGKLKQLRSRRKMEFKKRGQRRDLLGTKREKQKRYVTLTQKPPRNAITRQVRMDTTPKKAR